MINKSAFYQELDNRFSNLNTIHCSELEVILDEYLNPKLTMLLYSDLRAELVDDLTPELNNKLRD